MKIKTLSGLSLLFFLMACGNLAPEETLQPEISISWQVLATSDLLSYFNSWTQIPEIQDKNEPGSESSKAWNLSMMKAGAVWVSGSPSDVHFLLGFSQPDWGPAADDGGTVGYGLDFLSENGESAQIIFYGTTGYSSLPPSADFNRVVLRRSGQTVSMYENFSGTWMSGEIHSCAHSETMAINTNPAGGSGIFVRIVLIIPCLRDTLKIAKGEKFRVKAIAVEPLNGFRILDEVIYNGWMFY